MKRRTDTEWNSKTYHTFLRIMCEKELIACKVKNARDIYYSAKYREPKP